MARNSSYWEKRIAANTWKTYNSLEEKNRVLLEFYQDASRSIRNELYDLGEKHSKDGVLTRSEMYRQNHLTELNRRLEKEALELGKRIEDTTSRNMEDGFKEVYHDTAIALGVENYSP